MKLDYRCRAIGCAEGFKCRRHITGDAGKASAIPYAAFDMRDTVACDGYLPRQYVGDVATETEGGEA